MENNKLPTRQELKTYFETDKYPTQDQFAGLIDAYWHKEENIPKEKIAGLENLSLNYALKWSPTDRKLSLADSKGILVSEISLQTLDDEGTDLRYNPKTAALELYNADNKLLGSIPVSDFVKNVGTQLALNSDTLQLKDSRGTVLSSLTFAVSNISGLQSLLDSKAEKTVNIGTVYPLQGGGSLSADQSFSILQANTATAGYVSSADWNTFNNKMDKPSLAANYLARWNGSAFANSLIQDNGTSSGIGSTNYSNVVWSVDSTTKAALVAPRMTQAQRLVISLDTTQTGALVYQTDASPGYYVWNGNSWQSLGGANIATADLKNTQARVFTQNAGFTWDTSGNPYYLKGLSDIGDNLKDYPKVLKLNPATKQLVEGDALVISIPDTLPNPATPTSQTLNIVHTYTNSPTALDTNVEDLNRFIMNIGNLEFTNLTIDDWNIINAKENNSSYADKNSGIVLKCDNPGAFTDKQIMACAYPNLVFPNHKNWVFMVGCTVGVAYSSYMGIVGMGVSSAKTNVGMLQSFLSSLSAGWDSYNSLNFIENNDGSTPAENAFVKVVNNTLIFTKVGNVLNTTVRSGNYYKSLNTDITGINSCKPLLNLVKKHYNDTTNSCTSDFGSYYIEP